MSFNTLSHLPAISAFISDTYATRLYATCEGFPLWNPSHCNLGDIGYIRQGTFHALFNAEQGPRDQSTTFSSDVQMARRTSIPGNAPSSPTSSDTQTPVATTETGSPSPPALDGFAPRRSSLTRLLSGLGSPHGMVNSGLIERRPSPLPLLVEREPTRIFDVGPRMSNNYRSIGFSIGGDLSATTGVPMGATISFETSGGTGALLVAKDPIHRHLLRHRAILKGKVFFLRQRERECFSANLSLTTV